MRRAHLREFHMRFVARAPEPEIFTRFAQDYRRRRELAAPESGNAFVQYPKEVRHDLLRALHAQFLGKCAYCEMHVGADGSSEIELFRPNALYGVEASLDWGNLLLACKVCNRNKGERFPLRQGRLDPHQSFQNRLASESPILLHPCIDQPDDHLRFSDDGRVHGLTEQGRFTISILDLNRLQLVEARTTALFRLALMQPGERDAAAEPDNAFTASLRHLLQAVRDSRFYDQVMTARARQAQFDAGDAEVATDRGAGLSTFQKVARYIERVELENIGPFKEMSLNLLGEEKKGTPGFALLGENGIGKSTILRAIACALMGRDYARRLRLTSDSLLSQDAMKGRIMVRVTGYRDPIEVTLRKGRPLGYKVGDAKTLVLAYGASRLLASGRHKAENGEQHAKVRNLFDPFVPVSDASAWLDDIGPERIDDVRATLERILNDGAAGSAPLVQIVEGKLRFAIGGAAPRPVTQLSDGYKALIGMAGDVIAVMHRARFETMQEAMGIVLVDELGNHFHPQLKLRIVGALRTAFPGVQFIYSTHEPLCLRGLTSSEIAVLRRDEQGVYLLTGLPDVATMRIDQLLASEHFGLGSTMDPEYVAHVRRYHALVRDTGRSKEHDAELAKLQALLADVGYLGGTRRERMLLSLLDMHGDEPARAPGASVNAKAMSERTVNRLKQILQAVGPSGKEAA